MVEKVKSRAHPSHYLIHKYWGRKAHNLVATYIKHFTKKGELVLDPFMGSGGVVIESKKIGRNSVGIDINPITKLLVDSTIIDIEIDSLEKDFQSILKTIPDELQEIHVTRCPICKKDVKLSNAVWEKDEIARVKGSCSDDGTFVKDADKYDRDIYKKSEKVLTKYELQKDFYYPKDKLFKFVRRNGKSQIDHLFSKRNTLLAAFLLREINNIKDKNNRELLLLAFTSMLPNISSMIPADLQTVTGKSGWQISKFWVPSIHTEKNVIDSFKSRFKIIYKAKSETQGLFTDAKANVKIYNSEKLPFISSNSVDYIFTDPPYGDSIAYLGLSMFWNSWLKFRVDYDSEIIYDTSRNKDEKDYSERLNNAFSECYRVLKPGKYMSFTFHNRHVKFWKIVIDSVLNSGFELKNVVWQSQAVKSGTQGINRKNTLMGDFVYTFQKVKSPSHRLQLPDTEGETIVIKLMNKLLISKKIVTTPEYYEQLIPILVKNRAFLDLNGKILNIDKVLSEHFKYTFAVEGVESFGWTTKKLHDN
jgi:hypothetical protein